jgi:hypothetical protein
MKDYPEWSSVDGTRAIPQIDESDLDMWRICQIGASITPSAKKGVAAVSGLMGAAVLPLD